MTKILSAVVCVLAAAVCVSLAVWGISYMYRPYSPEVVPDRIRSAVSENGTLAVKWNDAYYELEACEAFADLFVFESWEQTKKQSADVPVLSFRLAEEWIVDIHSDGKATAYYGYSPRRYKSEAYYVIPTEIVNAVSDYVAANGVRQERKSPYAFYH